MYSTLYLALKKKIAPDVNRTYLHYLPARNAANIPYRYVTLLYTLSALLK
jgi:hypothetical protein